MSILTNFIFNYVDCNKIVSLTKFKDMNELKQNQMVKYGNTYLPYSIVRQLNAFHLLDKTKSFKVKYEYYTKSDFILKRRLLKSLYGDESKQVVYQLCKNNKVVYIGQTVRRDIYQRFNEHLSENKKDFDSIRILIVPTDICIDTLESRLIFKNEPIYNKTWSKGGTPISNTKIKSINKYYINLNKTMNYA